MTKVVILCGGLGTRIGHETKYKPKPMIKIGKKPIIWHLMKIYQSYGYNDFILSAGYKHKIIERYFRNSKEFNIKIVNTGLKTNTAGRILLLKKYIKEKYFFMTYGDGLSNVNINKLIKFHYKNKAKITLTAVRPKQRYGVLKLKNNFVKYFDNSNKKIDVFINGGFFVISKDCLKKIKNSSIYWEKEPMSYFLKKRKLFAFKHHGFWKSLDTLKDKNEFQEIINSKKIPWKI